MLKQNNETDPHVLGLENLQGTLTSWSKTELEFALVSEKHRYWRGEWIHPIQAPRSLTGNWKVALQATFTAGPKLFILGKSGTQELAPKSSRSSNHQLCRSQGNTWVTVVTWVGQLSLKMRPQIRAEREASSRPAVLISCPGCHTWHLTGHLSLPYLVSISYVLAAGFLLGLILPSAGIFF